MLTVHGCLGLGVAFLGVLLSAVPLLAQKREPAQLLAAYVQEWTPTGESSAADYLAHVVTNHGDYPATDLEAVLRGLEEIALTGTSPRLRAEAASFLTIPGSTRAVHPVRGRFSRLERVYHDSTDPVVRLVLIRAIGDQIDRRKATAFLEGVAAQGNSEDARSAIGSLQRLGEEGRTGLKRLYDGNAVRNPEAKSMLEVLAKYDFRDPPAQH
jgi:hypothetical protein